MTAAYGLIDPHGQAAKPYVPPIMMFARADGCPKSGSTARIEAYPARPQYVILAQAAGTGSGKNGHLALLVESSSTVFDVPQLLGSGNTDVCRISEGSR
jgi:hypothetical protein